MSILAGAVLTLLARRANLIFMEQPANKLSPSEGGKMRASKLSPERRSEIARQAVRMRWAKARGLKTVLPEVVSTEPSMPEAKLKGVLRLALEEDFEIPCYVLNDGQRVIGRTSATEWLTGIKGGGGFEKYLAVGSLKPFINMDLVTRENGVFSAPRS